MNMSSRVQYLDGLRGLAILLVLMYHAFARWPEIVPYGDTYAAFPVFKYGWVGVQLFFLISGYVILMTLERCNDPLTFVKRRWLRLFPAMLACSLIVFISAPIFFERPAGAPDALQLIPGLTFLEPSWWSAILGVETRAIEGAFWSIFVEFKFYIFAAIIYYLSNSRTLIICLISAFLCSIALKVAGKVAPVQPILFLDSIVDELSFRHFGWFAAGAAFYVAQKTGIKNWWYVGIATGLLSALVIRQQIDILYIASAAMAVAFFFLALHSSLLQRILACRTMMFLGFISYPLYLLHENMMIALIIKLGGIFETRSFIIAFAAMSAPILLAYIAARFAEPKIKELLTTRSSVTSKRASD